MAINYQGGNDISLTGLLQPMMQQYQQNRQQQIKLGQERKKESQKIADQTSQELSKVSRNGLREVDLPEFNSKLQEAKDLFFDMGQTQDPSKARELKMQINSKLGEVEGLVYQSRKIADREYQSMNRVSTLVGKGRPDDYKKHLESLKSKKAFDITDTDFDDTPFVFKSDIGKFNASLDKIGKGLLASKDAVISDRGVIDSFSTSKGKTMDVIGSSLVVKDDQIFSALSREYNSDPNFKTTVDEYMVTNGVTDLNQALASIGEQYKQQYFTKYSENQVTAEKSKGVNVSINPFGSNKEKEQAIEYNAPIFTFRDKNGKVIGEYKAKSHMALNKTQSLSGVISGKDPYTGQDVRIDNPKNAEVFGIFENDRGTKLLQIRYEDENGEEQLMISPNIQRINRAELSNKELKYLQGWEEDVNSRATTTRNSQKNSVSSPNKKPKFN